MSALASYNATNFVLTEDYSYRFNQIECGQPEVAVELSGSGLSATPVVTIAQWWRAVMEERASFKYIGMKYDTAKSCANAMRSALTFQTYQWEYGAYLSGNYLLYGWHKGIATPTLESEVRLEHNAGSMYDVVVNAKCTTTNYDKAGRALQTGSTPLATAVASLPGWSATHTLSGEHFDAASANNITLVVAPTKTIEFELVAAKLVTTDPNNLSGFTINDWYRATTDQYAQVRYEGMTKTACRSLFSSLNGTTGWYLLTHPWEYGWNAQTKTLSWHQNTNIDVYQCLNDFKATEDESGLFTAELTLHAQRVEMTSTPTSYTAPAYPAFWSSKIPGLNKYL